MPQNQKQCKHVCRVQTSGKQDLAVMLIQECPQQQESLFSTLLTALFPVASTPCNFQPQEPQLLVRASGFPGPRLLLELFVRATRGNTRGRSIFGGGEKCRGSNRRGYRRRRRQRRPACTTDVNGCNSCGDVTAVQRRPACTNLRRFRV